MACGVLYKNNMSRPGAVVDRRDLIGVLYLAAVTSRCFGGWRAHLCNDNYLSTSGKQIWKCVNVHGMFGWRGLERAWDYE